MSRVIAAAYNVPFEVFVAYPYSLTPQNIRQQIERFPEGQFIALDGDRIIGMAVTMRTHYSPDQRPHKWIEAIGDTNMSAHQPNGNWLYGVEFAVLPEYRGQGVGTRMYDVRFNLVKRLNLRGFYAGGMLMGYHRHRHEMTPGDYARRVIAREMNDPTVTMQMNRGFRPVAVIENYLPEEEAGNCAVQLLWENPTYRVVPVQPRAGEVLPVLDGLIGDAFPPAAAV